MWWFSECECGGDGEGEHKTQNFFSFPTFVGCLSRLVEVRDYAQHWLVVLGRDATPARVVIGWLAGFLFVLLFD